MFVALVLGTDDSKDWVDLKAENWDEAQGAVVNQVIDYYAYKDDPEAIQDRIGSINVLEVTESRYFDLNSFLNQIMERKAKEKLAQQQKKDEEEYERLRKKLGK